MPLPYWKKSETCLLRIGLTPCYLLHCACSSSRGTRSDSGCKVDQSSFESPGQTSFWELSMSFLWPWTGQRVTLCKPCCYCSLVTISSGHVSPPCELWWPSVLCGIRTETSLCIPPSFCYLAAVACFIFVYIPNGQLMNFDFVLRNWIFRN